EAMRSLAEDGALRLRMGEAAAALMQQQTWDRVAERTLAVYYDHIARRNAELRTPNSELRTLNSELELRTPQSEVELKTANSPPDDGRQR
ncbi:MAG TPA: hypothetical protein VGD94_22435, partial [Vicinamibacterales bacterium]